MNTTATPNVSAATPFAAAGQRFHMIVPAAGSGSRMGGDLPKQYMRIGDRTILEHTLAALLVCSTLSTWVVVLSPEDVHFLPGDPRVMALRCGGASRRDSVLNALNHLMASGQIASNDWVLVHDAARPGLSLRLLESLIEACANDPVGGLLALPVADTLKRSDAQQRVAATLSREGLWQAQTPQMFRAGLLLEALRACPTATDEAMAMEYMGHAPKLVAGAWRNMKLTYREDLDLAQYWLEAKR